MKRPRPSKSRNNLDFMESNLMNDQTYFDYLDRFKRVALSIFEWINLPNSMDSRYLELALYYDGMAALFKDSNYGFINTRVAASGDWNIYGLPTTLNCYSYSFHENKKLYTGLIPDISDLDKEEIQNSKAILVMNNWDRLPTEPSLALFAQRLALAERSSDTNIEAMRTPVMILVRRKSKTYNGKSICSIQRQ